MIQAVEERVTNIRKYLERDVSFDEMRSALITGFEETFNIELEAGELTDYENELVDEYRKRYSSREWVYKR
jgi:lipoate-protein ligase A